MTQTIELVGGPKDGTRLDVDHSVMSRGEIFILEGRGFTHFTLEPPGPDEKIRRRIYRLRTGTNKFDAGELI